MSVCEGSPSHTFCVLGGKMIKDDDVLQIGFYEYGQCFTGSDTGMRYRIAREPLENVHFTPMDKRGEAHLKVTIWPEPFAYDKTAEELKEDKLFEYSQQGLLEAVAWLNQQRSSREW